MKKFLVVGDNSFIANESARTEQFRDYLVDTVGQESTVEMIFYDDIVFCLAEGTFTAVAPKHSIDLQDYDAIYLRGKRIQEYFIAKFCAFHAIPCINDYSMFYSGTKLAQTVIFLEEKVKFLPTYYSLNNELLAEHVARKIGYPFILKTNKGSHGDSNYLIRSEADWRRALKAEPHVDFIAQQFCENDRDYRLLLVGTETLLYERRRGANTHLNNTSKGGTATALPISTVPTPVVEQVKSLAHKLGLHVAGFDIIPRFGTDELYFLEINFQPQLRTGVLLAEKQALLRQLFETF